MVAGKDVCLRRLAKGNRAREVRFNRFLGNAKVTTARVIESWSEGTVAAAEGRHVLAIQDTSEINFATMAERRRGLGENGKGNGRGVLLHPMLAVDAENGSCLGLVSGQVWTRKGRRTVSHDLRDLSDKEFQRWIATALAAKPLVAELSVEERRALQGWPSESTYHNYRNGNVATLSYDVLTRISLLIGMFKALHILYPDFADRWMRLPNFNPMFGGRPPIDWMTTDGGMDGLYRVRRLLDARRGGWN
jgi:hypothetical protein